MSRNRKIHSDRGNRGLATDFGATGELRAFLHGEHLGFDVAGDLGLVFQLTTVGSDFTLDFAEYLDLAGGDVAFDLGVFTNGDLAFVRVDFTFDFSIDDHVIRETNGADDFDSGGEDVGSI